ncbi:MAG: hypothetical protein ACFFAZ_00430 [Promethearchaeota archaeon]
MRRVGAAIVLMVWLGSAFVIGVSANEGPTIEWYDTTSTASLVLFWDGAYTGQTEEVWTGTRWINDTDGIDTVIFRYRWMGETEWMNRTATLIEGNATLGRYQANFTYAVWWNYEFGYPETEGSGGNFYFKIWANDTLGNWNEVLPMQYTGGYMIVEPPFDYILWRTPLGWLMIGLSVAAASLVIIFIFRRRA